MTHETHVEDIPDYSRILRLIAETQDVKKLTTFVVNAQRKNVPQVRDAALQRLEALQPVHKKASFEAAFWEIYAAYQKVLLLHERPVLRLRKVRRCALDEGEVAALTHWVKNAEQSWAFGYFKAKGTLELTAESLVLRFPKKFEGELRKQAKQRLSTSASLAAETV